MVNDLNVEEFLDDLEYTRVEPERGEEWLRSLWKRDDE